MEPTLESIAALPAVAFGGSLILTIGMMKGIERLAKWYKSRHENHQFRKAVETGKPPYEDRQLYFKFMAAYKKG